MASTVIDRGQTAIGSVFTLVIIVLVFSGVITVAYGYISSPTLNAGDTSSESAIITNDIVYNTLSSNDSVESSRTQALSVNKSRDYFIHTDNESRFENYPVVQAKNIYVNVTIKNITSENQNELFIYDKDIDNTTAGRNPSEVNQPELFKSRGGYSSHQKVVLIGGEMAVLKVRTWEK